MMMSIKSLLQCLHLRGFENGVALFEVGFNVERAIGRGGGIDANRRFMKR